MKKLFHHPGRLQTMTVRIIGESRSAPAIRIGGTFLAHGGFTHSG
jgi:hypothetical protein